MPVQLTEEGIWMEKLDMEVLDYLYANPAEAGRVFSEVEDTLARYHAAGFYHGDVNVQNIMMRGDRPVFIDPLEYRPHLVSGMQQIDLERLVGAEYYTEAWLSRNVWQR
jgi:RIO-like serine/threonine protein kinase